ncbi:MAG TPA: pyridoxamine 5'-phosphate oxidase family protein [Micromonosporaceae bacterium]
MGKVYEQIDARLREFILDQPVFFVATAPSGAGGHVNLSPKGVRGTFAVLDGHRVAYLDYTGSGAETIAHLRDNGRITVMFCAFTGPPKIVRLHGHGRAVLPGEADFDQLSASFSGRDEHGLRAIIEIQVSRVSDSCGYAVPLLTYAGERTLLTQWALRKSDDELVDYRRRKNAASIDGMPALA